MSALKTPQELERMRTAQAVIDAKARAAFVPEKTESKPVAYFEVSRYTTGNFRGLFLVHQLLTEDSQGKQLRKPIRKLVVEGVDMVVAMAAMETALRKRVFR